MSLNLLPKEILFLILTCLKDRDKISLISTSKAFRSLKEHIDLGNFFEYEDIKDSPFFDNYTSVIYHDTFPKKIPKRISAIAVQEINEDLIAIIKDRNITNIFISSKAIKCENFLLLSNLSRLRHIHFFDVNLNFLPDLSLPGLSLLGELIYRLETVSYGYFIKSHGSGNSYASFSRASHASSSSHASYHSKYSITFNIILRVRMSEMALVECYIHPEKLAITSFDSLEVLTTYEISFKLPPNLRVLRTHKIEKDIILPASLEDLECDKAKSLCNCKRLRVLKCNKVCSPLPDSIQEMTVRGDLYVDSLPSQLKKLYVSGKIKARSLPESLEKIKAGGIEILKPHTAISLVFTGGVSDNSSLKLPNLRYLELTYSGQLPLGSMQSLRKLMIWDYRGELNDLPDSLEVLRIERAFFDRIPKLPSKLRELYLGDWFSYDLPDLPDTLRILELGDSFNRGIRKLPRSLEILSLGNSFNRHLPRLPDSLRELRIGDSFRKKIKKLPQWIRIVELGESYVRRFPERAKSYSCELIV